MTFTKSKQLEQVLTVRLCLGEILENVEVGKRSENINHNVLMLQKENQITKNLNIKSSDF